jgi:hypothetical protein
MTMGFSRLTYGCPDCEETEVVDVPEREMRETGPGIRVCAACGGAMEDVAILKRRIQGFPTSYCRGDSK